MAKKPKQDTENMDSTQETPETAAPAVMSSGRSEREGRSKREWIQPDGTHGQPDTAVAVRYTYLKTGDVVDYPISQIPDHADRMLCGFGALTLFGNVVNTEIHGGGDPDRGGDAIRERIELMRNGQWIERGGDGVGARINKDALAQATSEVMQGLGKATFKDGSSTDVAAVRQRLEEDTKGVWTRQLRQVDAIKEAYARLAGVAVKTKTVDDL